MTYEIYRYIFFGGAILSAVMLITTIVIFISMRIPAVIGYLSGAAERKAIENIRNQNNNSKDDKNSSSLSDDLNSITNQARMTRKISTQNLTQPQETTILQEAYNTIPSVNYETTVLSENPVNETTVLTNPTYSVNISNNDIFEIEFDITYIHSDEIIQ